MSDTLELKGTDLIPYDHPDGLEKTAEYVFSHMKRDSDSDTVIVSGYEIDVSDTENLKGLLITFIRNIYWQ